MVGKGDSCCICYEEKLQKRCNLQNAVRQIDQLLSRGPGEQMTTAKISRKMSEACPIIPHLRAT